MSYIYLNLYRRDFDRRDFDFRRSSCRRAIFQESPNPAEGIAHHPVIHGAFVWLATVAITDGRLDLSNYP
jgi:hypothetical protein